MDSALLLSDQSYEGKVGGAGGKRRTNWSIMMETRPLAWTAFGAACALCLVGVCTSWSSSSFPGSGKNPDLFKPASFIRPELHDEPVAKKLIRFFDMYLMMRGGLDDKQTFIANVAQYLEPEVVYETVGFPSSKSVEGWANGGEERMFRGAFPKVLFTQCLFFGQHNTSTTTSYGTLKWVGDLFGVRPSNSWITLRVTDFYIVREDDSGTPRIQYNFMLIDWADVMRQGGATLLKPSPLQQGLMLPPAANDGVPAPFSVLVRNRDSKAALAVAEGALQSDWGGRTADAALWHEDMLFHGPFGVGFARGVSEYREHVIKPFQAAFSNRNVLIEITTCEGNYCGIMGKIRGVHSGEWLGLRASGLEINLRFCMHWRVIEHKAQEGWLIFDMPGLFKQLGRDFFKEASEMAAAS